MKFKKVSMLVAVVGILTATSVVFAKNEAAGQGTGVGMGITATTVSSPSGNAVGNQNQVQTQNQGEESMLQVNTAERENLGSLVSQKVQELLDDETLEKGIGLEVKQFVREQKQIQDNVQMNLKTAGKRTGLLKSLIGPDYKALKNAKTQLEQNQMRLKNLVTLRARLTNESDITMVTETIQALVDQDEALQDEVSTEETSSSLLGWLFKLFAR